MWPWKLPLEAKLLNEPPVVTIGSKQVMRHYRRRQGKVWMRHIDKLA
jgi:hypothetical protein